MPDGAQPVYDAPALPEPQSQISMIDGRTTPLSVLILDHLQSLKLPVSPNYAGGITCTRV